MKKLIIILLACCYLLVTTGVVTVSHYCMDRLASVSLFASNSKKCSKCGMHKQTHGCCHDKESLQKVETNQFKSPVVVFDLPATEKLPVSITAFLLAPLQNGNALSPEFSEYPPPIPAGNDIYLQHNVFRI